MFAARPRQGRTFLVTKIVMSPQRLNGLRAEQVAGFYRNSTPGTVGGMIAAPILSGMLVYENAVSLRVATIFVMLLAASTLARLVLIQIYKKPNRPWKTGPVGPFGPSRPRLLAVRAGAWGRCFCLTRSAPNISSWCS
jgi:hypothetical protein